MEYALVLRVSPSDQADTYAAHLFLSAHHENTLVGTEQIWECKTALLDPRGDNDAHLWALYVLRNIVNRLDSHVYGRTDRASVKLMLDVFKHQED